MSRLICEARPQARASDSGPRRETSSSFFSKWIGIEFANYHGEWLMQGVREWIGYLIEGRSRRSRSCLLYTSDAADDTPC
eukprot:7090758-Pyramimonas_sp.AAC.1